MRALTACLPELQNSSTGMIFHWKRSIYPKQSVSFKSVAFGTKLVLRKKKKKGRKKGDEPFDKVERLHSGLSGVQCFKMTPSRVSKREMHCKTKRKMKKAETEAEPFESSPHLFFFPCCFPSRRRLNLPGFCSILERKTS